MEGEERGWRGDPGRRVLRGEVRFNKAGDGWRIWGNREEVYEEHQWRQNPD